MSATKEDLLAIEVKLNGHLTSMETKFDKKMDSYTESMKEVADELKKNSSVLTRLVVEGEQYRSLIKRVDDGERENSKMSERIRVVEVRQSGILEIMMRFGIPIACAIFISFTKIKGG